MEPLMKFDPILLAFLATLGTWGVTAIGASVVFLLQNVSKRTMNVLLGCAAGIMTAASFWSLLEPAIRYAALGTLPAFLVVTAAFLIGAGFLLLSDWLLNRAAGAVPFALTESRKRSALLIFAITLHNIPEGLAIGVSFGCAGLVGETAMLMAAFSLALGIGIQNFPEGAAVALPLRREGMSRWKSFLYGQFSGLVEPVAGVLGALMVVTMQKLLPWALAFAAGAMIYVVASELIPEACSSNIRSHRLQAACGVVLGFAFMMLLDVGIG